MVLILLLAILLAFYVAAAMRGFHWNPVAATAGATFTPLTRSRWMQSALWLTGIMLALASSLWVAISSIMLTIINLSIALSGVAFALFAAVTKVTATSRRTSVQSFMIGLSRSANSTLALAPTWGRIITTRFGGGTAYAVQLAGRFALLVIGSLAFSNGSAYAGDAGLAAASSGTSWTLFALVGFLSFAIAGLATAKFSRRD